MFDKLQTIRQSVGLKQSAVSVGGSIIAAGLSAVATLIITRKLGPEEFGIFSVGFAITQILVRLTDFGMTSVVQRFAGQEKEHGPINRIFSYSTKVRLLTWIGCSIIGVICGSAIASLLNFKYPLLIIAAFILVGPTYFYEHFQSMLQSIQFFGQSAVANIVQAFIKILVSITTFIFTPISTFFIFSAYMIAPVLPFVGFKKIFPKWVKIDLKKDFGKEKQMVSQFAFHSTIGFISAGIIENIDVLFVQKYLTTYEAGLLGGASKIALLFSIVAYSLGNVLNARVARYHNKADIQAYIKKAWLVFLAAIVGFVIFIPFARLTLIWTIGPAYLEALPLLLTLVASSFLSIAVVPFIALFFSFDKPFYFSSAGILQLAIIIGGNILLLPEFGLNAAAWTRLAARLVLMIWTLAMAWRAYQQEYEKTS